MRILYLMMGIPASGKSTIAKRLISVREALESDVKYVSRDEIRFSILESDDEYFAKEKDVFRRFVKEIQEGIDNYEVTIADATFLNWASRKKALHRLRGLDDIRVCIIWCKCDVKTAAARNSVREGRACVPDHVIQEMYNVMMNPHGDPFNYHEIIEVDTNG